MNNLQEDINILYEHSSSKYNDFINLSGIYKLRVNNRIYVGSSHKLCTRINQHLCQLRKSKHYNTYLQNSYNKYLDINIEILEITSKENLLIREQHYIDKLNPEYNIQPVAGSPLGSKHSEETKRRMSETRKGRKLPDYFSEILSKRFKGVKLKQTHVDKIKANYKRERFIKPIVAINIKTGQEYYFDSVVKCQNILGVYQASISRILRGKEGTYSSKGYTFRQLKEE